MKTQLYLHEKNARRLYPYGLIQFLDDSMVLTHQ